MSGGDRPDYSLINSFDVFLTSKKVTSLPRSFQVREEKPS